MRVLLIMLGILVVIALAVAILNLHIIIPHSSHANSIRLNASVNNSSSVGVAVNVNGSSARIGSGASPSIVIYNVTGLNCTEVIIQTPRGPVAVGLQCLPILQQVCPPPWWRPGMPPVYCPMSESG